MTSSCVDAPDDYLGETSIRGLVRRDGNPVEGAYVRLTGTQEEFVAEQRTLQDGAFRFWVVPGDWTVICLAPGAERLEQSASVDKGKAVDVKFELLPAGSAARRRIRRGAAGSPRPGADSIKGVAHTVPGAGQAAAGMWVSYPPR